MPAAVGRVTLRDALGSPGAPDTGILGVTHDSRRVKAGDVFVAVRGFKEDGARFAADALRAGAAAVVSESPAPAGETRWVQVPDARGALSRIAAALHGHADRALDVVGVTGTNGKSTTASLLQQVLSASGRPAGLMGTVEVLDLEQAREAVRTTPEAPEVHAWLARLARQHAAAAVMEVSSHSLALSRVADISFAGAIFTNLTRDHLDFHGDLDSYFGCKRRLFTERLSPGGWAVLPARGDRWGDRLAEDMGGRPCARIGVDVPADVAAENLRLTNAGMEFTLRAFGERAHITTSLIGRLNVENLLMAAAAALLSGVPLAAVAAAAPGLRPVKGRLERVDAGQPFAVVVDYAHTDDALKRALDALRPLTSGRLITVFGCGGDRDRTKRPLMGAVVARLADVAVVTSDNPRSEDPLAIIQDVKAGMAGARELVAEPDRAAAIAAALRMAKPGDLVVLMGKGHETTQTIGSRVIPFEDATVALRVLAQMGFGGSRAEG